LRSRQGQAGSHRGGRIDIEKVWIARRATFFGLDGGIACGKTAAFALEQ
jgi:hypothetical protein